MSSPFLLHPHPGAAARHAAAVQPGVALEREGPEELLSFLPFFLPSLSGERVGKAPWEAGLGGGRAAPLPPGPCSGPPSIKGRERRGPVRAGTACARH